MVLPGLRLDQPEPREVLGIDHPNRMLRLVHHHEIVDAMFLEDLQHFRREALGSARLMAFAVLWPLASALALWWAAALAVRGMDAPTVTIGVGGICLGLIPLALARRR